MCATSDVGDTTVDQRLRLYGIAEELVVTVMYPTDLLVGDRQQCIFTGVGIS